jgi:hypothetical protein
MRRTSPLLSDPPRTYLPVLDYPHFSGACLGIEGMYLMAQQGGLFKLILN